MFKNDLFAGKRILVTGGGTGLGKAMAAKFLELGAEVVIWGRRGALLEEAAAELTAAHGGTVVPQAVDIRVPAAIDEALDQIWTTRGPLDGLVNNAAGNFISRTEDLSPRGFDAIANIVFHGTFYTTLACGKRWLAEGRPASVVSILTTWVWTGSPYVVPSAMSKAGVAAMTKSLAVEWGPRGIRLNAICPGPFPTEGMSKRLLPIDGLKDAGRTVPLRRIGELPELANLAAFLMADEVRYITGEVMAIDGGQWLTGGGTFSALDAVTAEQWGMIRDMIKATNDRDKASRSA